jgi:hypothetical protein
LISEFDPSVQVPGHAFPRAPPPYCQSQLLSCAERLIFKFLRLEIGRLFRLLAAIDYAVYRRSNALDPYTLHVQLDR